MKILVIAPTPFFSDRGTHIRILEEAYALEDRGHEITLATYHIGKELPKDLHSKIDVRRIRRLLFWYKKLEAGPDWQKIILDLLLIKKVFFLARTKRPEIIHAHLHEGVLIGWLVQKILFWRNIRLVADFHGSLTKEMVSHAYLKQSMLQKIFRAVEVWIDNMGDVAVASSWDNAEEISAVRKEGQVTVLPDGTRLRMFDGLPDKQTIRETYDVPENKVVVAYTGALIPNKGIKLFLEAIPLLATRYTNVHFVVAGFPVDQITDYIATEVFQNRVTIVSPLPYYDLPKVLRMSDIGVDPKDASVRQASGKTLQYMGAGLPVAVFDTENNREYLAEGGTYAKEATAESLALAIGELVESEELRKSRGEICRKRAEAFSWEHTAELAEGLYQNILNHK
ncbi:MAG: glycosyltransferase family 4 protein [Candidatus Moranbacteria bacterium]|nr:glycosyltransferase family 4 protein [Candidatus Moranbacteria bacterium]